MKNCGYFQYYFCNRWANTALIVQIDRRIGRFVPMESDPSPSVTLGSHIYNWKTMTWKSEISFRSLTSQLDDAGLNLCAQLSLADLADSMPDLDLLTQHDATQPRDKARFRNILLIGSAGKKLWQAMPAEYLQRDNPVDEYSVDCVNRVFAQLLPDDSWQFLFPISPSGVEISLQSLGLQAGWHHASPLGIGINGQQGLWFAYRAVLVVECDIVDVDQIVEVTGESPCLSCDGKPCLSRCPAQALDFGSDPDLSACVAHRVLPESECVSTCLARLACPVAPQFKYSDEQVAYFYQRSLASAISWVASAGE